MGRLVKVGAGERDLFARCEGVKVLLPASAVVGLAKVEGWCGRC